VTALAGDEDNNLAVAGGLTGKGEPPGTLLADCFGAAFQQQQM
jgi:hypothetical protein